MKVVADSFAWPFRGDWKTTWLSGLLAVLLLPIAFIPLLGYAIAATRAAQQGTSEPPPKWVLSIRLLTDGFWTAIAIALLTAPFLLLTNPFTATLYAAHLWHMNEAPLSHLYATVIAAFILALPWGLLLLLHMPHATARFASTGNPQDLFNFRSSINAVKNDFATWNLAAAAIVTGWAIGLACVGLLCLGIVPGIFYAILVSAHASAVLETQRPKGQNPPPR
jgi:hypothetical protein